MLNTAVFWDVLSAGLALAIIGWATILTLYIVQKIWR